MPEMLQQKLNLVRDFDVLLRSITHLTGLAITRVRALARHTTTDMGPAGHTATDRALTGHTA